VRTYRAGARRFHTDGQVGCATGTVSAVGRCAAAPAAGRRGGAGAAPGRGVGRAQARRDGRGRQGQHHDGQHDGEGSDPLHILNICSSVQIFKVRCGARVFRVGITSF
jgi:hypothetical protein